MAQPHDHLSDVLLSTAWMPLDGLIQQWGRFGAEAISTPALHAASATLSALAREMQAREHHMAAWHTSREVDLTELENTLKGLNQARDHWTDAITALELLILDKHNDDAVGDAMRTLVVQAMEQRLRVSSLIREVEQEQFAAYRERRIC